MSEDYVATVRIRRPARVRTDGGRNVWAETVEEIELELVSTTQLQALLQSGDGDTQGAIRQAMSGQQKEGVLARDPATGLFQVISEDDLKSILEDNEDLPIRRRPADMSFRPAREQKDSDELSLVSTRMLRKIIQSDETPKDRSGGFDPYNSG